MTPLIGEIQLFAGNFAPEGWRFCDGQLVSIAEYEALFATIGTNYGGDGIQTFALPNLTQRLPVGMGQNPQGNKYVLGQSGGSYTERLTVKNIPSHTHKVAAKLKVSSAAANNPSPEKNYFGSTGTDPEYASTANAAMNSKGIDIVLDNDMGGSSQPIDNRQSFVSINFIIAMEGVFPIPA
jgi:microcystin-dependent protein